MRSESSFEIDGDLIIIEATVVGPNGRDTVRLLLDTGSVLTTLIPTIAESIGYTSADRVARSVVRSAVAEEPGYIVDVTPGGLVLRERAPGVSADDVAAATGAPLTWSGSVPEIAA